MQTKRIALTDNSFEAGGKKFIIHSSVNIELYRVLEELQVRARFGSSFAALHRGFEKVIELINKSKRFEADIALHNMMQGTARAINKQHDPLILICTLFCWPDGEERKTWDEEQANETIKLWSEEGYPVEDFLLLGLQFVRHYQTGLLPDMVNISDQEPQN
jgi:hypothetical protein